MLICDLRAVAKELDQALLTRLPQPEPGTRPPLPRFDMLCTNSDSQPL